jgi:hypothetical protein
LFSNTSIYPSFLYIGERKKHGKVVWPFVDLSVLEISAEPFCFVAEPVSMATLLSLAAGSLLLLLILVCFTVYAMRREKCCFARKYTSL